MLLQDDFAMWKKIFTKYFLKIWVLAFLVTTLILKTSKNPIEITQKEAQCSMAINSKVSSKLCTRRNNYKKLDQVSLFMT